MKKPAELDENRTMLWLAPRKVGSGWSKPNIYPWAYDWMFTAQIVAFTIVFLLLLLPLPGLLGRGSRRESL